MMAHAYLAGVVVLVLFGIVSGAKLGAILAGCVVAWIVWSFIDSLRR